MKILDPLAFIVAHSLARVGAPVPVQTHPVPSILKQNSAVGCRPAVRLVENAFPMLAIPGFREMLRSFDPHKATGNSAAIYIPKISIASSNAVVRGTTQSPLGGLISPRLSFFRFLNVD